MVEVWTGRVDDRNCEEAEREDGGLTAPTQPMPDERADEPEFCEKAEESPLEHIVEVSPLECGRRVPPIRERGERSRIFGLVRHRGTESVSENSMLSNRRTERRKLLPSVRYCCICGDARRERRTQSSRGERLRVRDAYDSPHDNHAHNCRTAEHVERTW